MNSADVNSAQAVDIAINHQEQALMTKLTEITIAIQSKIQGRIDASEDQIEKVSVGVNMLHYLEKFMKKVDSSSVGSAHVEIDAGMSTITSSLELSGKVLQQLSNDLAFDKAWYEGNEQAIAFSKQSIEIVSDELQIIIRQITKHQLPEPASANKCVFSKSLKADSDAQLLSRAGRSFYTREAARQKPRPAKCNLAT
ncbi:hypothetical protein HELRODRAFT_177989 [Helobdella robusta]|uniref:Uncharacterized protein n=1 Tax=Helobdella robusta TaxID=6412 RepID=T1FCK8_HELRO|nr:hypothetical protein HELRODRAFT_177989 [Helobdella robusta]ESN97558.1 hypothetical protein HELRODRAFT_177989 [Helobdella robusta]